MSFNSHMSLTGWCRRLSQLFSLRTLAEDTFFYPQSSLALASGIASTPGKELASDRVEQSGNVVSFPFAARHALWRLANELNARVAAARSGASERRLSDPIFLAVSYGSQPRLFIDSTSHVELGDGPSLFRVILGGDGDARVSLETSNYEKVKQFVWEYLQATVALDPRVGTGR